MLKNLFTLKNLVRNFIVIISTKNTGICYPPFWKETNSYFSNFFGSNWNNIKNTWKGIKSLITLKDISTTVPRALIHNNKTVINPVEVANIFNKHLVSIAEKTRASVIYSHKHFSEYMKNNSSNSFFLSPTSKNEISSIISSLNPIGLKVLNHTSLLVQIAYLLIFLNC